MAHEPILSTLRGTVAAGEQLRMELLSHLWQTPLEERGGVQVELMMFYGQAFGKVAEALSRPLRPGTAAVRVLHDAICGQAVYSLWRESETTVDAAEDFDRMTRHWEAIARTVLRDRD